METSESMKDEDDGIRGRKYHTDDPDEAGDSVRSIAVTAWRGTGEGSQMRRSRVKDEEGRGRSHMRHEVSDCGWSQG